MKNSINNNVHQIDSWSCECVGPQNGQKLCPCKLKAETSEYDLTQIFNNLEPHNKGVENEH